MTDIEAGLDEDGVTLGNYTGEMAELGINVLNAQGKLRDMGEVIEEIGGKWSDYSREQQVALAQTMAGTRQYNNLIALFDHWDDYIDTLEVAKNAQGTLQEQQDIYMESTRAHLQSLETSWESLYSAILDPKTINTFSDAISVAVKGVTQLVSGLNGGKGVLLALGSVGTQVFSKQIGAGVSGVVNNLIVERENIARVKEQIASIDSQLANSNLDPISREQYELQKQLLQNQQYITSEQAKEADKLIEEQAQIKQNAQAWKTATEAAVEYYNTKVDQQTKQGQSAPTGQVTTAVFDNIHITDNVEAMSAIQDAITEQGSAYEELNERIKQYKKELEEARKAQQANAISIEDQGQVYGTIWADYDEATKSVEDYLNKLDKESDEYKELKAAYDSFIAAKNKAITETDSQGQVYGEGRLGEAIVSSQDAYKKFSVVLSLLSKDMQKNAADAEASFNTFGEGLDGQSQKINNSLSNVSTKIKDIFRGIDIGSAVTKFSQVTSSVLSVVQAINTLSNLGNIWSDETLSSGEKMLQTITAIGAAIPGVIRSIQTLSTVFNASLGVVALVAVAVTAVGASLYQLATVNEKARKKVEEANTEYEDSVSNLESLKSSLTSVTEKIEEMEEAKRNKTEIVDESELASLKAEEAQLKVNIETEKQLAEIKRQRLNEEYETALKSGAYQVDIPIIQTIDYSNIFSEFQISPTKKLDFSLSNNNSVAVGDTTAYEQKRLDMYNQLQEAQQALSDAQANNDVLLAGTLQNYINDMQNAIDNFTDDYTEQTQEAIEEGKEAYDAAIAYTGDDQDVIEKNYEIVKNYYQLLGNYKSLVFESLDEDIVDEDSFNELRDALNDTFSEDNLDIDALKEELDEDLFETLTESAEALGLSLQDYLFPLIEGDGIASFEQLRSAIESVSDAIDDIDNFKLSDSIESFWEALRDGKQDEEEYLDFLDKAEAKYPELTKAGERYSHAYLQMLREISDAEEAASRQDLMAQQKENIANYNAAIEKAKKEAIINSYDEAGISNSEKAKVELSIDTDTKSLEDAIKDIIDTNYEIEVSVKADMESDIESAHSLVDEFTALADTIGENVEISIEDARKIAEAGYGAIFENAQATTEGTIRLDEEKRDAFIAAKKAELEADTESARSQLVNDKTLVETQIEALDAELGFIDEALNAHEAADKAEAISAAAAKQAEYESNLLTYNNLLKDQAAYQDKSDDLSQQSQDNKEKITEAANNYVQDSESAVTTQQAQEINKRIENLGKLYNALYSYGKAVREAESGVITTQYASSNATGGGGRIEVKEKGEPTLTGYDNYGTQEGDQLLSSIQFDEIYQSILANDGLNETSKAALEAQKAAIEAQKSYFNDLLGKYNEGIAELDLAPNLLDNIGKTSSSSGSSGSSKTKDEIDYTKDPYYEVNLELDEIESKLKKLQAESKNLFGQDYIDNQLEQIELFNQQIETYGEKTKIAGEQIDELKQKLSDFGFTFDENGKIVEGQEYIEDLTKQYNAMSAEEQDSETGKALKKKIDDSQEMMEDYNEAFLIINENAAAIAETGNDVYQAMENMLPADTLEDFEEFNFLLSQTEELAQLADAVLEGLSSTQEHLIGSDLVSNINSQLNQLNIKAIFTIADAFKEFFDAIGEYRIKFESDMSEMQKAIDNLAIHNDTFEANFGFTIDTETIDKGGIAAIKYIKNELVPKLKEIYSDENYQGNTAINPLLQQMEEVSESSTKIINEMTSDLLSLSSNIISVISNLVSTISSILQKKVELSIEKFNIKINAEINIENMRKQWEEFREEVIDDLEDDDYLGIMKQKMREFQDIFTGGGIDTDSIFDPDDFDFSAGIVQDYIDQIYATMGEVNKIAASQENQGFFSKIWNAITGGGSVSAYGIYMQDALDDLASYTEDLEQALIDAEDKIEEAYEAYNEGFQYIKDGFDDQLDEYEDILDEIEHNKNIISLLYGDDSYEQMAAWYEMEEKANNGRLDFLTQTLQTWQQVRAEMEAAGDTSGDAWDAVVEGEKEAAQNLNDALEDAIQTIIDKYQNAIEEIFDSITDRLTNGMGLDYVSDEWDLITNRADTYLDDINSAYAIQKLAAKFQDAINDNSGNLSAQKQITALMNEQLEDLKERDRLTEYDVERAEKLLNIELARIALENAQQNKSTMRLKRDANGNYSYQYVADQDAIDDAEQNLADLQNELYNFDKDQFNNNLNELYNLYQEYNEKIVQIATDNTLSEEERQAYLEMLTEEYQQQITNLAADYTQIRTNLQSSAFDEYAALYTQDAIDFENMTQEEAEAFMSNLVETWVSGNAQMAEAINGEGGFAPIAEEALAAIKEAEDAYNQSLYETQQAMGGIDFTSYEYNLSYVDSLTTTLIDQNETVNQTYKDMADELIDLNEKLKEYTAQTEAYKQAAIEAAQAATELYNANYQNASQSTSDSGSILNKVGATLAGAAAGVGTAAAAGAALGTVVGPLGTLAGGLIGGLTGLLLSWDTGGYTGSVKETKGGLAILHEKELVLNAEDTENMLDTVNEVRDISSGGTVGNAIGEGMQSIIASILPDIQDDIATTAETGVGAAIGALYGNNNLVSTVTGSGVGSVIGSAASSIISQLNQDSSTASVGVIQGGVLAAMMEKMEKSEEEAETIKNNQLGAAIGALSSKLGTVLEQAVHIDASFPNATDQNGIIAAIQNLVNVAAQRAMIDND